MLALQVELPMVSVMASTPDLSMGEECRKADLDTVVGEEAKILPEAVAATWEVHRLLEILPTTSRVPSHSQKLVT
jgi:hypothetical protein